MLIFGHVGMGALMAQPFKKTIQFGPTLIFGCLLPDIIDKALFFFLKDHVLGSRSYGHTLLFLLILGLTSVVLKSSFFKTLSFGVLTHFVLDYVGDALSSADRIEFNNRILLWPLNGFQFPETFDLTLNEHIHRVANNYTFWTELVGFGILIFLIFKDRRFLKR